MESHKLEDTALINTFIMAGNATFTVVSLKTGTRFTYKIRKSDNDDQFFFVSVLSGPDNWSSYLYLGYIRRGVYFHGGRKAKIAHSAPSAKAFDWFYRRMAKDFPVGQIEFWHEGRCGRCGRKLTVPSSIESGFGPECIGHIGIAA